MFSFLKAVSRWIAFVYWISVENGDKSFRKIAKAVERSVPYICREEIWTR